ncbi:MAG: dihydrodipicolinate synthase family protein [Acidobacteria bacterium]|nr:dihydrodipicolinate synthase family protein [Acidobacteriota bacterium]
MTGYAGVFAALLAPRNSAGDLDLEDLRRQIESLSVDGISGYAINGATGEFPFSTAEELRDSLDIARRVAPSRKLLAGIGAGDVRGAVLRGKIAADSGADAVLLPMPGFFPYRQDDLRSFSLAVADQLKVPVLLYNLPQFTTGLAVETTLDLLRTHDNIVGVKDSSGSLDTVRAITESKLNAARIIGNDGALCEALGGGLCDGVVSGVACALPELMTRIFAGKPSSEEFVRDRSLLDEFIAHLSPLPTPWGLKAASEVRGFAKASYPFPLSSARGLEVEELHAWFRGWMSSTINSQAGTR